MQVRRRPGFGLYLIIIVLVVVLWFAFSGTKRSTISEKGFEKALSEGRVASVIIDQHSQVPTGSASITLISDKSKTDTVHCVLYISNVNEFQTFLKDKGYFDYVLNDVDSGGWFMQFLPMLIIIFIVFVLFMMILGAQSSGGSGAGAAGSRMMNFGKSRAKMTGGRTITIRSLTGRGGAL